MPPAPARRGRIGLWLGLGGAGLIAVAGAVVAAIVLTGGSSSPILGGGEDLGPTQVVRRYVQLLGTGQCDEFGEFAADHTTDHALESADLSSGDLADTLGAQCTKASGLILSAEIESIDESISGDEATVEYVVTYESALGDDKDHKRDHLVREGARWKLDRSEEECRDGEWAEDCDD